MPDELTVAIQEAIARARERCERCRAGRIVGSPQVALEKPHTCDGDLAIAKRLALAAARGMLPFDQYRLAHVEAEIERLLREGSERGKE